MSQLTLKFEESLIVEEEVFVSYGFREFLTDVGGLLGLFLGCSMLSLMELIYFPVVYLVRILRRRKGQPKSMNEVKIDEIQDFNTNEEKSCSEIEISMVSDTLTHWRQYKNAQINQENQQIATEIPGCVEEKTCN